MQQSPVFLLLAGFFISPAVGASFLAAQQRSTATLSPITRVVDLLKDLMVKTEQEDKAEEDLYESFVCWGKTVIATKEASNAAAQSRIDSLKTYIADLDAGRIELTTERGDLTKEIETLSADIQLATDMRNKEESDFLEAKDEMDQAIKALTAAIEVLREATKDHKKGVLLNVKHRLFGTSESRAAEAAVLSHAVHLGEKFLTKGDSVFLRRLLTGDVPTWDWKKLNRPATFKMGYKARSFKIQDVLSKLLETFATNLDEATKKEAVAKASFEQLMSSKNSELSAAQEALEKMAKENGARGMSKEESQEEVDALNEQVDADNKYIEQVTRSLADKKQEWKDRQALRLAEQEAISKAISILHGDDARDLFAKSLKSQGYLFLQESASSRLQVSRGSAAAALRQAALQTHDKRVVALITRLATGGHFDEVIAAIDAILTFLKEEADEDLDKKEACEEDRATDTRAAIKASRDMDEMTELINTLKGEIEEITKDVEEKEASIKEMEKELEEATKVREEENAEYKVAKKDDEDAAALVASAKSVLATFYSENGLMLTQTGAKQPAVAAAVEAGKAPPPPPTTWEAPYAGKTEESTGIIAILGMIKEDIEKDIEKATAEETKSQQLYEVTKTELTTNMANLKELINQLTITKGKKEQTVEETKGERSTTQGTLESIVQKIKDAEPGCDFFTINFPLRSRDRQIELDGLIKAKAILQGAEFNKPADPSREIKPGDALLQRKLRH